MDAARVQDQLTEQLMQELNESKFLHYPLMNRIEERVRTKEQLTKYTAVLVHKLEERKFQDEWLIDRIDRVMDLQQRLERYESSVDGTRSDSAADHNG
jgi:hypothetical protein